MGKKLKGNILIQDQNERTVTHRSDYRGKNYGRKEIRMAKAGQ